MSQRAFQEKNTEGPTLCHAIMLPARKSAFRAGFWPDCYRERTQIGLPAGLRPAGGLISVLSFPGSSPAKIRPGRPIYGPEALLHNIEYLTLATVLAVDVPYWCLYVS